MKKSLDFTILNVVLASVAAGLLSGCATSFAPGPIQPNETPIGNIQGMVHGGQAPVTGAHIYLYAAGTGGYGTNAVSLIKSTGPNVLEDGSGNYYVVTDSGGNFALGGDYSCTEGTQVYMVAVGGNPGQTGTVNNTAIVQMAGLGQCPSAGNLAAQVPYLVINEVTTVAFAYSLSGFATTPFNVSSNAANSTASAMAIANAMANTLNIVNIQYGQAPAATNGNSTSVNPVQKLYALANILATCVNTSSPASSACTALFSAAKDSSGNNATSEASAIFNIAHNQGQNVGAIWNRSSPTPVFSPTLGTQPADWTVPIVYKNVLSTFGTNGANQVISGAYNIAFDVNGNAWIGDRQKGLVEMSPLGATHNFDNAAFGMIKGIAIAPDSSAIWLADYQNSQVDIVSPSGALTQTIGAGNSLSGPAAVAFDANGNAFVVNETNGSVTAFSSTGAFQDNSGSVGVATPAWISVDQNGNAWIPSTNSAEVGQIPYTINGAGKVKISNNAGTMTADDSYGLAIDSSSNAWFATNTITGNGNPGTEVLEAVVRTVTINPRNGHQTITYSVSNSHTGTGNNGGGLGIPYKITVDGGNNIWMANEAFQTVSGFSTTQNKWLGVAATGYNNGSGGTTLSATPDNSGNLWTANTDGSVTVLLGLSTPTSNPIFPGDFGTMP
jgi:hypothetical protein